MIGNGLNNNLNEITLLNYKDNNIDLQLFDLHNLKVCLCTKI